ncbi:hypothetical protein NLO413_0069 [Candidatus Neoehrlichia lotoris str. RAC413]|uniref:Uncharacterized protein n=1 Tax=Candidatus Neoehrlichia procyonis str. RAC413 TaxID=1359163 RepID=A0A0F3NKX8_9RICK|nr:hypothetical protein NLO413_0069 [Candidatus Neoehrlichia lotoris str. RAC413]
MKFINLFGSILKLLMYVTLTIRNKQNDLMKWLKKNTYYYIVINNSSVKSL